MDTPPHKATNVDTTATEHIHVLYLANIHANNMDSSDRAAIRGVNNECRKFISETATKLVCSVSSSILYLSA